ncbi:hypothetical protein OH76DRAFT_308898 [Lentinus brumalis]|uniref:Uncharacterized protein n=1 Tax=Lentinus brumalis TaxID=2498619 RepID=A0A371CKB7_9APHY|nr:hypothetical protein OH76DRAFT_308898 [Polyporus brumalis]
MPTMPSYRSHMTTGGPSAGSRRQARRLCSSVLRNTFTLAQFAGTSVQRDSRRNRAGPPRTCSTCSVIQSAYIQLVNLVTLS